MQANRTCREPRCATGTGLLDCVFNVACSLLHFIHSIRQVFTDCLGTLVPFTILEVFREVIPIILLLSQKGFQLYPQGFQLVNNILKCFSALSVHNVLLDFHSLFGYNQRSKGGGPDRRPCSYGLLVIRRGLVALNDSVGFDRDRYPLCKIGMFDQDFQQLFQSFFVVVHFYHLLSTLLLYIFSIYLSTLKRNFFGFLLKFLY